MHYFEFLEALARSAEKISMILPTKDESVNTVMSMSYNQKIEKPLNRKLYGLLTHIYFIVADKIKEVFRGSKDNDYF